MTSTKTLALAAALTSIGSLGALADATGAEGYVKIFNVTPGYVVTGFYTNAGQGWTTDWLTDVTLTPGEGATAEFSSAPPACNQQVAVGWMSTGGREIRGHPVAINICNVSNVFFEGDLISFE